MTKIRLIILILLIGMIVTLIVCISPLNKNLQMSFSPLFQLLGEPVKSVSTAVGRILPIDDIDEVELGKEITKQFHFSDQIDTQESKYLTAVLKNITVYSKRKMNYQIFIMESEYPNAFALPGGTIVITRGLLGILDSESELISVLAHEMGHIEQSHCLNSVKYRIAANKVGMRDLGSIGDFASRLLVQHAYSKTQENEADEYAFKLISQTQYDPNGVYLAFKRLNDSYKEQRTQKTAPTIIDDYFTSHPRIEHRLSKFKANGMQWWQLNPNENRYIGIKYLQEKSPFSISQFKNEWTNTKKKQE